MLYQALAKNLETQIHNGLYRPGERMPSVRQLAREHEVSVSTAVSAYHSLERTGLIKPRPKSGFYVSLPSVHRLTLAVPQAVTTAGLQPAQLSMSDTIARIFAKTRDRQCTHFDLAVPDPQFQPIGPLKAAANRVLRHRFADSLRLCPSPGESQLRRQIAHRMSAMGCRVGPEDVVMTNGCQEALLVTLQALTKPGDVVAVETPCYYGFLQALESLGLNVVSVATHPSTGLDLDDLAAIAERWPVRVCLCAPSYSNPTGACMPDSHKPVLLALAQRFDFLIIEDDIFGELSHQLPRPKPLLSFDETLSVHGQHDGAAKRRVVYCSSFSKSLSPGLRLGWVIAGEHRLRVMERQRATTTGTATLPQLQLAEYLQSGHYDKHLQKIRREYQRNIERALATIAACFPLGTQVTHPNGGFVLWLLLPDSGPDAMTLLTTALAHNVCFVPGDVFGRKGLGHYLRISVAQPWSETLEAALVKLGQLASQLD